MLNMSEPLLLLILIALISLSLVNVFCGRKNVSVAKRRITTHVCFFFVIVLGTVFFGVTRAYATGADDAVMRMVGSIGQGLGFIAATLTTGFSTLGVDITVVTAAPAATGAFSESEKNFGKSMIFVALGEGATIYSLLISIFIIFMKL